MGKGNEKFRVLDTYPSVFIAPLINNYAYQTATENGIRVVISDRDPSILYNNNLSLDPNNSNNIMLHLLYTILSSHIDENKRSWDTISLETIKMNTLNNINDHGYAVIEIHPQTSLFFFYFSSDPKQFIKTLLPWLAQN